MKYIEKDLIFYEIMKYPVPIQSDFFVLWKELKEKNSYDNQKFSRKDKNPYLDSYIQKIEKYEKLYKSIPFISEIFLCNSISFNALKSDSDIDIFIITKKNSIWRARFFSVLYFSFLWLKRSLTNKKGKFCLTFYITENHKNLYPIILKDKADIYLAYRLAHLVPLYQETKENNSLYKENPRFKSYLPNHPQRHCIDLWCKTYYWTTKSKIIIEKIFWGFFGIIVEKIISSIWRPILKNKVKKLWNKWKRIVINNNMLKFHDDKRDEISSLHNYFIK